MTDKYRDLLYNALWDVMLKNLDDGEITVEDSQAFSEFVVGHLDEVKTGAELIRFLTEIGKRWPVYEPTSRQLLLLMLPEFYK